MSCKRVRMFRCIHVHLVANTQISCKRVEMFRCIPVHLVANTQDVSSVSPTRSLHSEDTLQSSSKSLVLFSKSLHFFVLGDESSISSSTRRSRNAFSMGLMTWKCQWSLKEKPNKLQIQRRHRRWKKLFLKGNSNLPHHLLLSDYQSQSTLFFTSNCFLSKTVYSTRKKLKQFQYWIDEW